MSDRDNRPVPQDCPFCFNLAEIETDHIAGIVFVVCTGDHDCGMLGPSRKTVEAAVQAWNRIRVEDANG